MVSEDKRRKVRAGSSNWKESTRPDRDRPAPGKKDTRRWCRGRVGREHLPQIVIPKNAARSACGEFKHGVYDRSLGVVEYKTEWMCMHVLECAQCGKHLQLTVPCPDNGEGIPQLFLSYPQEDA